MQIKLVYISTKYIFLCKFYFHESVTMIRLLLLKRNRVKDICNGLFNNDICDTVLNFIVSIVWDIFVGISLYHGFRKTIRYFCWY